MRLREVSSLLVLGAVVLSANGLQGADKKSDKPAVNKMGHYVHVAILQLKKDVPENEVDVVIADAHKLLRKVPSVRGIRVGKPAEKSTPKLAQKDYSIGVVVFFDNAEGLEEYIGHPLHKEFVQKHQEHFEKILVYDFLQEPKKN